MMWNRSATPNRATAPWRLTRAEEGALETKEMAVNETTVTEVPRGQAGGVHRNPGVCPAAGSAGKRGNIAAGFADCSGAPPPRLAVWHGRCGSARGNPFLFVAEPLYRNHSHSSSPAKHFLGGRAAWTARQRKPAGFAGRQQPGPEEPQ